MLRIDIHEPEKIKELLRPCIPEGVSISHYNEMGYADYGWLDTEEKLVQVERTTWSELMSGADRKENQLGEHLRNHPEARLIWLLEGIALPTPEGFTTINIFPLKNLSFLGKRIHTTSSRERPLKFYYKLIYQFGKFTEVYCTPNIESTAHAILSFYESDQKAEHTTLRRHLKTVDFNPDPMVGTFSHLAEGIGISLAERLVSRYANIWNLINADPKDIAMIPGIGLPTAKKLLRRLGRPDV